MAGHRIGIGLAVAGIAAGLQGAAWGMATRPVEQPTVLVVPGLHIPVLKVGFDVLQSRNVVLVSYQQAQGRPEPVLHVWNGTAWVSISMQDYEAFRYLRLPPGAVVLVGGDAAIPPSLAVAAWQDQLRIKVLQIPTVQTAELLNELGRIFHFNRREWEWYAARYQLEISDANQALRGRSFYDQGPLVRPGAQPKSRAATATPDTDAPFGEPIRMAPTGRTMPAMPPEAIVERESMSLPTSTAPQSTPGILTQPPSP
jgi:hypothetical protein